MSTMRGTWGILTALAVMGASCAPTLGDAPFSCADGSACPTGYSCASTVCVRDGTRVDQARPARVVWINSGEMTWVPEADGSATLVVNDGFTQGAHGIYSVHVGVDGATGDLATLVSYGDEYPMSSSVVALDAERYGIATLRYPDVSSTDLTLEVLGVPRHPAPGTTPAIETLYTDKDTFLGGTEPPYISALSDGKSMDICWTRPTGGGRVEVTHLERTNNLWKATRKPTRALPDGVLPLSGDCLLWRTGPAEVTARVGLDTQALVRVTDKDTTSIADDFVPSDDYPIFAYEDGSRLLVRTDGADDATGDSRVSFVVQSPKGDDASVEDGYFFNDTTDVFSATSSDVGPLVALVSKDPALVDLTIGMRSSDPNKLIVPIAQVHRSGNDKIYSARAFVRGDKVFVAWTAFYQSLMDLWITVVPRTGGTLGTTGAKLDAKLTSTPAPKLVWSARVPVLPASRRTPRGQR
jgi:hypothetical protein